MATELAAGTVGMMRGYCDNDRCAARDVHVLVKLYDVKHAFTAKTPWCCPQCQRPLAHVDYQTLDEHEAEGKRYAHTSVNVQRYQRDQLRQGWAHPSFIPVPMSVFMDETLPE